MKVEQQMFTSGKPEFVTIAITNGLNRDERIALEQHSLYLLPTIIFVTSFGEVSAIFPLFINSPLRSTV